MGRTGITMIFGRDLEITLKDVMVHKADFYQALLGRDVLKGKKG